MGRRGGLLELMVLGLGRRSVILHSVSSGQGVLCDYDCVHERTT